MTDPIELLRKISDSRILFRHDLELDAEVANFLSAQPSGDGWIPVSERLPQTEHYVWSLLEGDAVAEMEKRFYDGKTWRYMDGSESDLRVTHWMPLPAAPKGDE